MNTLHEKMTVEDFETGYFYVGELKAFAKALGIAVGSLRKNELEVHIKSHLFGNKDVAPPKNVPNRKTSGGRDILSPDTRIVNYVDDKATKAFLKAEVAKRDPVLKDKSGQWYWLNDWRKSHVGENGKITYRDLIDRLYALMTARGRLPRIPSAEFNGFIADYLADPDNANATRREAVDAWEACKATPIRNNYHEYKKEHENGEIQQVTGHFEKNRF